MSCPRCGLPFTATNTPACMCEYAWDSHPGTVLDALKQELGLSIDNFPGESHPDPALAEFISGSGLMKVGVKVILLSILRRLYAIEQKASGEARLGLQLAERGDLPGAKRALRNVLDQLGQSPDGKP